MTLVPKNPSAIEKQSQPRSRKVSTAITTLFFMIVIGMVVAFDFEKIKSYNLKITVIHGDNDPSVPMENANLIKDKLDAELVIVPNGGHLSGHEGWQELPQVLEALNGMMSSS